MRYTYHEEGGYEQALTARTLKGARRQAEDLLREGSWGQDAPGFTGATVSAVIKERGEYACTVEVDLLPDDPECEDDRGHDMVPVESGCRENPGVWSTGGTGIVTLTRCTRCGRTRAEHATGMQRNPGEPCRAVAWSDPEPRKEDES